QLGFQVRDDGPLVRLNADRVGGGRLPADPGGEFRPAGQQRFGRAPQPLVGGVVMVPRVTAGEVEVQVQVEIAAHGHMHGRHWSWPPTVGSVTAGHITWPRSYVNRLTPGGGFSGVWPRFRISPAPDPPSRARYFNRAAAQDNRSA